MNIVKVSMIGANEKLPASDIIDFLRAHPQAEIGIGVSRQKGDFKTPRFDYVMSLMEQYNKVYVPGKTGTIALHINGNGRDGKDGWPYRVSQGYFPAALYEMMHFPDMSIQLNHLGYNFDPIGGSHLVYSFDLKFVPKSRLILSYCDKTAKYIQNVIKEIRGWELMDVECDVLYDTSFGGGKMANKYDAPLYDGVRQGYAGGLGPDNILDELPKIQAAQTNPNAEIWIDAEGKLQNDAKTTLDLTRAEAFYNKIMDFQKHK